MVKGYGWADLERKVPVSPETTLIRVASISKVITATAVMRLREQGKLDFSKDINYYLPSLDLHRRYPEPITLRDLLTHTAGFDSRRLGTWAPTVETVLPLERVVTQLMPAQVHRPGQAIVYADYDYTLLGYLIQVVSGVPFEQYVQREVLKPLGMTHSGFVPTAADLRAMSAIYVWQAGEYIRIPKMHPHETPAVGLFTTGADMARFLEMELGLAKQNVIGPALLEKMQTTRFQASPGLPGIGYGMFESVRNGQRFLSHLGAHFAAFVLFPEQGAGFFIAFNNARSYHAQEFIDAFVDRYFPPHATPAPDPKPVQDLGRFAGWYRLEGLPKSNIEKVVLLKVPDVHVSVSSPGRLRIDPISPDEFAPAEQGLFRPVGGIRHEPAAAFLTSPQGQVKGLAVTQESMRRLAWYQTRFCYLAAIGLSAAWFGLYLLWVARRIYLSRRYGRSRLRTEEWLTAGASLLNVGFLGVLSQALSAGPYNLFFAYGMPLSFLLLLWVPVTASALAAVALGVSLRGSKRAIPAVATAVVVFVFTTVLHSLKLLGFQN